MHVAWIHVSIYQQKIEQMYNLKIPSFIKTTSNQQNKKHTMYFFGLVKIALLWFIVVFYYWHRWGLKVCWVMNYSSTLLPQMFRDFLNFFLHEIPNRKPIFNLLNGNMNMNTTKHQASQTYIVNTNNAPWSLNSVGKRKHQQSIFRISISWISTYYS